MHTAKAPPMEIAEDVRRIMRSHMFVKNVDQRRGGGERLPLPSAIPAKFPFLLGKFRRGREIIIFPLLDTWVE